METDFLNDVLAYVKVALKIAVFYFATWIFFLATGNVMDNPSALCMCCITYIPLLLAVPFAVE